MSLPAGWCYELKYVAGLLAYLPPASDIWYLFTLRRTDTLEQAILRDYAVRLNPTRHWIGLGIRNLLCENRPFLAPWKQRFASCSETCGVIAVVPLDGHDRSKATDVVGGREQIAAGAVDPVHHRVKTQRNDSGSPQKNQKKNLYLNVAWKNRIVWSLTWPVDVKRVDTLRILSGSPAIKCLTLRAGTRQPHTVFTSGFWLGKRCISGGFQRTAPAANDAGVGICGVRAAVMRLLV